MANAGAPRCGSTAGAGLAALGALITMSGGCLPAPEHRCSLAEECGAGAACVGGLCAFPVDVGVCPSGLRYGAGAGSLAGTCAEPPDLDAGIDAAPTVIPPFGRGLDGPVTITPLPTDRSVNTCAPLMPAAAGATTVGYDRGRMLVATVPGLSDFAPDRLVLIWQTTGLPTTAATIGSRAALTLAAIGRYQLVRVISVAAAELTLAEPLQFAITAGAQACRVPELGKLTITTATVGGMVQPGVLRPNPWNGEAGGVIAVLASDGISVDGAGSSISTSSRGFRGGGGTNLSGIANGCTQVSGPPSTGGGAHRGEGVVPAWFSTGNIGPPETFGIGNGANGGGGGGCLDAGGGGGGGTGAAGGRGGYQSTGANTGNGQFGTTLVFDPRVHLAMGGGGGGGEGNNQQPGAGGPGGGVVLLRTPDLTCAGSSGIRASGGGGGGATAQVGDDGAGGGGGGGTIYVEAESVRGCQFAVGGGTGGDARADPTNPTFERGPGGGGGGGRVMVRAIEPIDLIYTISGGAAGVVDRPSMNLNGAESGVTGIRCGDGVASPGELCDDGNQVPGDGCDSCVR